jgi:hypothetical protein
VPRTHIPKEVFTMTKIAIFLTLLITALICGLPAAPAQAQAARTFISAAGSDSNNCINVATPCRHLATAFAATVANGEIYVLDPANYGSLTITHAVSIEGHGWASIAPVTGQAAITINASSGDKINIIGVVLDGTSIANTNGIAFNSGGSLVVRDSVIRNFTNFGIFFSPTTSSTQFFAANTLISDNGLEAIVISPNLPGTAIGALDHVELVNNLGDGLLVATSTGQTVKFSISASVIENNEDGIGLNGAAGGTGNLVIRNCTIANHPTGNGIFAQGSGANIRVTRTAITNNSSGWSTTSSGTVTSYADNLIDGNTSNNSEPPGPGTYH